MSYNIKTIPPFDKQLKRLIKKYPSLKSEFQELVKNLYAEPLSGEHIGNNCYKIRLAIASKGKGKGKRGGARVITNIVAIKNILYLVAIYDKSENDTLSETEILKLLSYII